MLMHAIAQGGCTGNVREFALEISLWEKNLLQHRGLETALVFLVRLYQLSYPFFSFKYCFRGEGGGVQNVHLDFHTAPEL